MALSYNVVWNNDNMSFDKFELQYSSGTQPLIVDLNNINGDLVNIASSAPTMFFDVPLLFVGDMSITIKDIYEQRYNSAKLYDTKWVSYVNNGQTTTEELFNNLKTNAKALYNLSRDETKFDEATKLFLGDANNEANKSKFLALIGVRYSLMKIAILLYISFTVAENPICAVNKNVQENEARKQEELNNLVQLLKDTTNLLVNIDAIPVIAANSVPAMV